MRYADGINRPHRVMAYSTAADLAAAGRLPNVEISNGAAWVFGGDYLVSASVTRRGRVTWEVTDMDAQEEIGGVFGSAVAAARFAIERGPIAAA
jgi:hypothetical protein